MDKNTLTQEDIKLIHKIEIDINKNPEEYRKAGRWLDGYNDEDFWQKKKKSLIELKNQYQKLRGIKRFLQGKPLEIDHLEGLIEKVEKQPQSDMFYRFYEAMHDLRKNYMRLGLSYCSLGTCKYLSIDDAKCICLVTWLLTDPDAHKDGLNITQFENWPWNKLMDGRPEFTRSMANTQFPLDKYWFELTQIAWEKIGTEKQFETKFEIKKLESLKNNIQTEIKKNKITPKELLINCLIEFGTLFNSNSDNVNLEDRHEEIYICVQNICDAIEENKAWLWLAFGDEMDRRIAKILAAIYTRSYNNSDKKSREYYKNHLTPKECQKELHIIVKQLQSEIDKQLKNSEENDTYLNLSNIFTEPIEKLIEKGECHYIEFKATLEYDIKTNKRNKDLNKECLKTIAAFLNTDGGVLLIGVKDDGSIFGIEEDLKYVQRKNTDGFELKLRSLIRDHLDPEPLGKIKIEFSKIENLTVCRIDVVPVNLGQIIHLDNEVYIRDGNNKRKLTGRKLTDWIEQRNKAN